MDELEPRLRHHLAEGDAERLQVRRHRENRPHRAVVRDERGQVERDEVVGVDHHSVARAAQPRGHADGAEGGGLLQHVRTRMRNPWTNGAAAARPRALTGPSTPKRAV